MSRINFTEALSTQLSDAAARAVNHLKQDGHPEGVNALVYRATVPASELLPHLKPTLQALGMSLGFNGEYYDKDLWPTFTPVWQLFLMQAGEKRERLLLNRNPGDMQEVENKGIVAAWTAWMPLEQARILAHFEGPDKEVEILADYRRYYRSVLELDPRYNVQEALLSNLRSFEQEWNQQDDRRVVLFSELIDIVTDPKVIAIQRMLRDRRGLEEIAQRYGLDPSLLINSPTSNGRNGAGIMNNIYNLGASVLL